MSLWVLSLFIAFFVLMIFSALFSSSETVFFSMGPLGLRRLSQGPSEAEDLQWWDEHLNTLRSGGQVDEQRLPSPPAAPGGRQMP